MAAREGGCLGEENRQHDVSFRFYPISQVAGSIITDMDKNVKYIFDWIIYM